MDVESYGRWYAYSRARDLMFEATDTRDAPWYIARSDDKRRARLNCIAHLLDLVPYKKVHQEKVKLLPRSDKGEYDDQATLEGGPSSRRSTDRRRGQVGRDLVT